MNSKMLKNYLDFSLRKVKIFLAVLLIGSLVSHCENEDDLGCKVYHFFSIEWPCDGYEVEDSHPITGTWKQECKTFSNGSERESFIFSNSTSAVVLLETYNMQADEPASPDCSGDVQVEVTSQYDIVIGMEGQSVELVGSGSSETVEGSEIDYTLKSVEAFVKTSDATALTLVNMLLSGTVMTGDTVELALDNDLARPKTGGQLYRGAYFIRDSVSPKQLYTEVGETSNPAPAERELEIDEGQVYARQ